MKVFPFPLYKKEDNTNMNESLNIEEFKNNSLIPDKREKYDIYIPMIKDDDQEDEEDFI